MTRRAIDARPLFVVRCAEKSGGEGEGGRRFVFASFHGDTNGLATIPVVDALDKTMRLIEVDEAEAAETPVHWTEVPAPPLLLFGLAGGLLRTSAQPTLYPPPPPPPGVCLSIHPQGKSCGLVRSRLSAWFQRPLCRDANTHVSHSEGKQQGVEEFARHLASLWLHTCWGVCDPRVHTTFNARTFLQPQLNKAGQANHVCPYRHITNTQLIKSVHSATLVTVNQSCSTRAPSYSRSSTRPGGAHYVGDEVSSSGKQ